IGRARRSCPHHIGALSAILSRERRALRPRAPETERHSTMTKTLVTIAACLAVVPSLARGDDKIDPATMTKKDSGLGDKDGVEGKGAKPEKGQTCEVHYTGWLWQDGQKGKKFDSSLDRNTPFQFPVGAGRVIKGWDEGVATMKVGGKRLLLIPP